MPAQKEGPAPRITTTRTSGGSPAPMAARPRQTACVIALRRSGRPSVTVATAPSMSRRSPLAVRSIGVTVTVCS